MTAARQAGWSYRGRGTAGHGHAEASSASGPAPALSGVALYAAGAAAARSPAACSLYPGDHATVRPQEGWLAEVFGFRLITVCRLSPRHAVRVLLAVMMALPAAGAFLLAHASDTHPRLAPQVHPAGQAGSFMQAASARQAASAGRAAPAVVGGPADVQVKGAAVANAATGQVPVERWPEHRTADRRRDRDQDRRH